MTDRVKEKLVELLDNFHRDLSPFAGNEKLFVVDDNIEQAEYLIAHGVTVYQWIPVHKKLPKKGCPVLIRSAVGADSIGEYRGRGIWFDLVFRADNVTHGHGGYEYGITHWADPTQPPEGE